jgi:hypothetical protein
MLREVLEPVALFLAPFAAYVLYLLMRLRYPFALSAWSRMTVSVLSLAGLAVAVAGVLGFGLLAPRHLGAYVPAHVEGGKLVPGHFE